MHKKHYAIYIIYFVWRRREERRGEERSGDERGEERSVEERRGEERVRTGKRTRDEIFFSNTQPAPDDMMSIAASAESLCPCDWD